VVERAAALYGGPFADGFFLPGSGEFEQWVSAQRARLEDRIALALDRLAGRAEEAGQLRDALNLRKRLAAIRPLDTSAAVALMTTFAFAGDRAGALQYARVHEVLLKEQLGLDPDPAVVSLVARLREPVSTVGEAPAKDADDPERLVAEGPAAAMTIEASRPAESRPGPRAWRVPGARWWWSVPAIAAALVLALLLRREPPVAREAPAASLDQKVVVAPFRVAGASSSLAYLREGMVELLSTRLADDSSARSVDPGAVLAAWRAAGIGSPTDVPRSKIVGLARGLGAEQVVIGSVVGGTRRLVITATVVEAASQRATAQVTVEGPADSISGLVDRLAAKLLVLDAGEDASLASRTTESLPALRAFLGGQEAFRQGNYSAAVRYYEAALRLDSTFALAALQLARTADRMSTLAPQAHALALAWRERQVLDARARALLIALAGPSYPMPSEGVDQIDAWERLIDLTPDRAEAWFELALRLVQEGAIAGATDAHSRGVWALRRALQLDPGNIPARELIGSITDDTTADSALPLAPFLAWRGAVTRGDSSSLRRLRHTLPQLGPRNLRAIAVAAQSAAASLGDARVAIRQLGARASRSDERLDAALGEHALALNQGRIQDALEATERLAQLQPGVHAHLRLRVLDGLYGDGDLLAATEAAGALRRFAAVRATARPQARALQLADACVLAQWRLHAADTTGIRQILGWLRAEPLQVAGLGPPIAAAPPACAELLEATLAVLLRRPDASQLVARVDSLAFTAGVSGDAVTYAPLLIARLHQRLGDPGGALNAIRRRGNFLEWPRYLATELREEGRYASLVGATQEARVAYGRYLTLRARPDSTLREQVEQVRAELAAAARTQ
jgi:DNA-binding SARP family transcriptional activator/TolB-like protein